jgi:hypothetical protein
MHGLNPAHGLSLSGMAAGRAGVHWPDGTARPTRGGQPTRCPAVRAMRNGAVDRWGRAMSGPRGSGRGAGGSASERGSVARGADQRARQHSAARFGFKPIQTDSKFFKV